MLAHRGGCSGGGTSGDGGDDRLVLGDAFVGVVHAVAFLVQAVDEPAEGVESPDQEGIAGGLREQLVE